MVVDYLDLNPDKMRQIAAFFGIPIDGESRNVESVFAQYSKDPSRTEPFLEDRHRKQELATILIKSAAHQWAMDPYTALRNHSRQ